MSGAVKTRIFCFKIINTLFERQNVIEQSINISTLGSYSVGNFENSKALETNPLFLQYLTEYSLINSLIEEIPKFMQNKNTKFYSSTIDDILRNIKYNTLERVTENDETLIISKTGNFQIKKKPCFQK